jgi:hypothetical protein
MSILSAAELDPGTEVRGSALPSVLRHSASVPESTIDTEFAQLNFFADDLLEVNFTPRTELKVPMVVELLTHADAWPEHRAKYLLIDISGLDSVDADVSCIFNSTTKGVRIALLGAGPADRVLARFFIRKINPSRQLTYVESRHDALAFLFEHD